jgi:hypothetical protein
MNRLAAPLIVLLVMLVSCGGALAPTDALSAPSSMSATQPARPRAAALTTARAVAAPELCVSTGRLDVAGASSRLHVDSGAMRAVIAGDDSSVAELDFIYRGPSTQTTPLASGELRRQIGLKLRAKDTCNVVYVMWHAAPDEGIAVSVKNNPGKSTHEACGDQGYVNLRATSAAIVPRLLPNERHVLRAEIAGTTMRVLVDGAAAWSGTLPPQAFTFSGPAGLRSDNGVFDFDLRVMQPRLASARCH